MVLKTIYTAFIACAFLMVSLNAWSQTLPANFDKANSIQIKSYKPKKARTGKNGSERMVIIQLFKGPKSGKSGKDGLVGPDLRVDIAELKIGDTSLLQLLVTQVAGNKTTDTFYVNPRLGQLKIIANGGEGGNGGQGEAGGGSPGSGGKGGMGGQIAVFFDAAAVAYANCSCLVFSNEGGVGGWSGENYGQAAASGSRGAPVYLKDQNGKILVVR